MEGSHYEQVRRGDGKPEQSRPGNRLKKLSHINQDAHRLRQLFEHAENEFRYPLRNKTQTCEEALKESNQQCRLLSKPREKCNAKDCCTKEHQARSSDPVKRVFERNRGLKPDQVDGEHEGNSRHIVNTFDQDCDERSTRSDTRIAHRECNWTYNLTGPPQQKNCAETNRGGCKEIWKPRCA